MEVLASQTKQDVPGGKVNILGVYVSYSERFPRYSYFIVQFQNC
jgi:hypothetical protein